MARKARRYLRISRDREWGLARNGEDLELWRTGRYGYMAGYVSRDDEDAFYSAIDAAEEEERVLMAEARAEFGV